MMLIMITHLATIIPRNQRDGKPTYIISKNVQPSIVRVRLLLQVVPHVMFSNEMTRQWVQTTSPEAGHDEIDEHVLPSRYTGCKQKIKR